MRTNCEENETAASIQISVHTEFEFLSLISFSVLTNVNSIVQQKRLSSRYVQPRKVVRVFKKEREKKNLHIIDENRRTNEIRPYYI